MYDLIKKVYEGFTALSNQNDIKTILLSDSPEVCLEDRCNLSKQNIENLFFVIGFISNPYNFYRTYQYYKNVGFKGGIGCDEQDKQEIYEAIKKVESRIDKLNEQP